MTQPRSPGTAGEFLVVGEAVVDLVAPADSWRFDAVCGGSPLNVAVGLAAAGDPTRLATQVGDDLFAGFVTEHLRRHGVDTSDLATDAAATSVAFARVAEDGTAAYDFRISWHWTGQPALDTVSALHVGSLGTVLEPGAAAVWGVVSRARARGVPVSYDPNVRPALAGDGPAAAVEEWVGAADVVRASDEDLAWLYPGTDPASVAAGWATSGPALVVLTRGGAGATAWYRGGTVSVTAPPVAVADTVGAGDAFTAGLLHRLATARHGFTAPEPETVAAALRHAVATAAAVCTHRGAGPAPLATVAEVLTRTPEATAD